MLAIFALLAAALGFFQAEQVLRPRFPPGHVARLVLVGGRGWDVEPVLESIVDMLACHRSQFFDWLPYNRGELDQVPSSPDQQRQWLRNWILAIIAPLADRYRDQIISAYGEDRGRQIRYLEAFETCEYGTPLSPELRRRLFPFLPDEGLS